MAVVLDAKESDGALSLSLAVPSGSSITPWRPVELGESVSVNGACLTVVGFDNNSDPAGLSFDVIPETLGKTTLGGLQPGDKVNLERSLRAGDSFGGHYVTGHVDGVGRVIERLPEGGQILFRVSVEPHLGEQMLDKGSISVDGISLTIVEVKREAGWFSFAAIPHTLEMTTLGGAPEGADVNIETDAFGKWALRGLESQVEGGIHPGP